MKQSGTLLSKLVKIPASHSTTVDTLAAFKSEYFLPKDYLYFSAHQLGPMSKRVREAMLRYMNDWQQHANAGWRHGKWLELEDSITHKLG